MKKILILLFVCFSIHANAQTQKEQVDKLVSRERVSTGILYNRVMPWAGLHIFGQNGRKDTSSLKHFKQSIYEMEVASNQKGDATYSFVLRNWMYHQNK